ncbi:RNA polymerase sigma factor [Rubripirellula tenax]|uniref:RNA polymerase sigma factor n=1 Tax=Rubripirellula tenax TaxID=2528015 RepID=A0A5C6EF18_9BACT|nr:RNA polymerase sigma factor [Rubripirellula tenax]
MIDAADLSQLWNDHASRLLLIARSMGDARGVSLADDAVQEAFIALALQPKLPDDPFAWMVRVVRNQILSWHRSGGRRKNRESMLAKCDWFQTDVAAGIDADEVTQRLMHLNSPTREVIVMHVWGEMTFDAIAEVLQISRSSAHRQFTQGIDSLRQQLAPPDLATEVSHSERSS